MRQRLWLLLLLPVLASGCVTHKLWSEKAMDEWSEPAPNPNLRLFYDAGQNDFLVVYDEYSNRHYTTKARAFFLLQNQQPLEQHSRPHFVSTNLASRLPPAARAGVFFDADQSAGTNLCGEGE